MANHLRRQIREAITTAVTGLPSTGANVFQSRLDPLQDSELPAILVDTPVETIDPTSMPAPRRLARQLTVVVHVIAKASANLDDLLDGITKDIEIALSMPCAALAGIAKSITLQNIEVPMLGTTEKPVGQAALTYAVMYFCAENAPDTAL